MKWREKCGVDLLLEKEKFKKFTCTYPIHYTTSKRIDSTQMHRKQKINQKNHTCERINSSSDDDGCRRRRRYPPHPDACDLVRFIGFMKRKQAKRKRKKKKEKEKKNGSFLWDFFRNFRSVFLKSTPRINFFFPRIRLHYARYKCTRCMRTETDAHTHTRISTIGHRISRPTMVAAMRCGGVSLYARN